MSRVYWLILLVFVSLSAGTVFAGKNGQADESALDQDLAELKADVAELNAILFELEEDILFPPDTQVAVFLSLEASDAFQLDSVDLSIDDRQTRSHLYTDQERDALAQGGVQQLYLGNLGQGAHRISATINGRGKNGQYFRKQQNFSINKEDEASRVELVVGAQGPSLDPEFTLKRWQ